MSAARRTLVAGIGNIFLGDDGFGVEVATRLAGAPVPLGARVEEFGIRGLHLAYELLEGYDALVLIDTVAMGAPPGTVAVIEPEVTDEPAPVLDAHTMSPAIVLSLLAGLGGSVAEVFIVGCEPADLDEGIGLSPPVTAAVEPAIRAVHELLAALYAPAETKGRA